MAFASLRAGVCKMVQTASYMTLTNRPMSYKSALALENLYPNSSLKLSTPALVRTKSMVRMFEIWFLQIFNKLLLQALDTNEKFNGHIPVNKLEITYSASSGPGGQNVNKVS